MNDFLLIYACQLTKIEMNRYGPDLSLYLWLFLVILPLVFNDKQIKRDITKRVLHIVPL